MSRISEVLPLSKLSGTIHEGSGIEVEFNHSEVGCQPYRGARRSFLAFSNVLDAERPERERLTMPRQWP